MKKVCACGFDASRYERTLRFYPGDGLSGVGDTVPKGASSPMI